MGKKGDIRIQKTNPTESYPNGFHGHVGPCIYPAREIVQSATLRGLVFVGW